MKMIILSLSKANIGAIMPIRSCSDDVFYANRNYIMIPTATEGRKSIKLPIWHRVVDVLNDKTISAKCQAIHVELPGGVTRIYRLAQPER